MPLKNFEKFISCDSKCSNWDAALTTSGRFKSAEAEFNRASRTNAFSCSFFLSSLQKCCFFSSHVPEIFTIIKIHSWSKIVTLFSQIREFITFQLSLSFALDFSIFLACLCCFHVPRQFYVSFRISFWSLYCIAIPGVSVLPFNRVLY